MRVWGVARAPHSNAGGAPAQPGGAQPPPSPLVRHDVRAWQVERRKRTQHLIELGGLMVKAGIVKLTGDDRAMIYGALIWMADKLQSDQGEQARTLWTAKGKKAFEPP